MIAIRRLVVAAARWVGIVIVKALGKVFGVV
jgi:hypothetical protein